MIQDAWIVACNEWRSIRRSLLPSPRAWLACGLILILFGGLAQFAGSARLGTVLYVFLWLWLVWLIIAGPISDAFAGERERRTIDALLATRLPDAAILLGKICAVAFFGCILTGIALLAAATLSLISGPFPRAGTNDLSSLALVAALTLPAALFASAAGALISLNSRSARQAHQAVIVVVPFTVVTILALDWLLRAVSPTLADSIDRRVILALSAPYAWIGAAVALLAGASIACWAAANRLRGVRVLPA